MGKVVDLEVERFRRQRAAKKETEKTGFDRLRPWTSQEDQALVLLWGSPGALVGVLEAMQKAYGRSLAEVCNRAQVLIGVDEFGEPYLEPVDRALMVMRGEAARNKWAEGGFVVHGRPATAAELIAAANGVLRRMRRDEIEVPA